MGKYKTVTIHYPAKDTPISDGSLGRYINTLFSQGIHAVQIINAHQPHEGHDHTSRMVEAEPPYTAVQGNVGSS